LKSVTHHHARTTTNEHHKIQQNRSKKNSIGERLSPAMLQTVERAVQAAREELEGLTDA
jgi:hypothetical protein